MAESNENTPDFSDASNIGIDWYAKGGVYNGRSTLGINPGRVERSMQDAKDAGLWEWREDVIEKQNAMLNSQKVSGRWAVIAAVSGILAALISAVSLALSIFHIT